MQPVLSLASLSKSYGPLRALNNVSFDVPQGSVFGILGPNGSGKTTLLSIVLDVLKSDHGSYSWFGEKENNQRNKIGSLLETPNCYHYLNAMDNLRISQSISGRGNDNDIDEVLRKVKLFERRNSRFRTFSLGMKQRLAIASALLGDPEVLLLDEPTNGLDPEGIAEIRDLIAELNKKGHTIIMASHLLDEVEKVCSHVAILKNGNLLTTGPVEEVLMDEDIVELGANEMDRLSSILKELNGVMMHDAATNMIRLTFPKGTAKLDEINRFCFDKGVSLNHLQLKKKKLEARFFELTNN